MTIVIVLFKLMKQHLPTSTQNAINLQRLQQTDSNQDSISLHSSQNRKISELTFLRNKDNKEKKISKKPETMILKLGKVIPHSFNHVHNILNILGLNERTLKDPSHEESYFKSMFYIKNVEKVELRKNAIIIFTKNIQQTQLPIQYLIERYRSFGDNAFFQLANSIENAYKIYSTTNFGPDLMKSYDGEPLSRYIEAMQQRTYMCKVAPNKIVISRKLLELLGEDLELYGLKICKYKTPFREIISGQSYYSVISKTIENIGLISAFLKKAMTFEELQEKAYMEFNDYLYTQQQKKIYCKFSYHMPTPLINCVQIVEQISSTDSDDPYWRMDPLKRKKIDHECSEQRYSEAETLKHLISLSDSLLINNKKRLAGYCLKQSVSEFLLT